MVVKLNNYLYNSSITISLDDEGKLVGFLLIQEDNGYKPIILSDDKLQFIKKYNNVMNKLNNNVIYINDGYIYLGNSYREGPYGEKEIFLSNVDATSIDFEGLIQNLEYKIDRNIYNNKKLLKISEFFKS